MRYLSLLAVSAILLTTACQPAWCDELKPVPDPISVKLIDIRLPTVPVTEQPDDPQPAPSPVNPDTSPVLVDDINAGELYVIESDSELKVTGSPDGIISVASKKGPRSFFARFVDGVDRDEYEDRTYSKPFVYVVQATKTGQCELLVFSGVKDDLVRQMLTVTVGPRPPPVPPGPTPPGPTPPGPTPPGPTPEPPAPIPGGANRVLIVYESSDLPRYTPEQASVFSAASVREYLARKCAKGPDGKTPEYRVWDKDVDTSSVSDTWKEAMKLPRQSLPWIIISNGTTGFNGPLPPNAADTLTLLKKYMGE